MKSVQIAAPSEMRVAEIAAPKPGRGEVLVKMHYVGFCGSDLNMILRLFAHFPAHFGREPA